MEERGKRIFGLLLISILFASILISSIGVVSAEASTITESFTSIFDKEAWSSTGDFSVSIAKILFFILIGIFIYIVIGGIFEGHGFLMFIFSFILAFLATAYIAPTEIYSLINSYTALGLTLTTLFPLLVLLAFTVKAAKNTSGGRVGLILFQQLMWILYFLYTILRMWQHWGEGSGWMNVILIVTALIALGFSILNSTIISGLASKIDEGNKKWWARALKNSTDFHKMSAKIMDDAGKEKKK